MEDKSFVSLLAPDNNPYRKGVKYRIMYGALFFYGGSNVCEETNQRLGGPQDAMHIHAKHNGFELFVKYVDKYTKKDGTCGNLFMFASFSDFEAFWKTYQTTPENKRFYQDLLRPQTPVYYFADLDLYYHVAKTTTEIIEIINRYMEALVQAFEAVGTSFETEDVVLGECHRWDPKHNQHKVSIHVHVGGQYVFDNIETTLKGFDMLVGHFLKEAGFETDNSVYKKNAGFRLLGCRGNSKPNDLLVRDYGTLELARPTKWEVALGMPSLAKFEEFDEDSIITTERVQDALETTCGIRTKLSNSKEPTEPKKPSKPSKPRAAASGVALAVQELLRQHGDLTTEVYMNTKGLYCGRNNGPRTCLINKETHESNNCWFTINTTEVWYHCHAQHDKNRVRLGTIPGLADPTTTRLRQLLENTPLTLLNDQLEVKGHACNGTSKVVLTNNHFWLECACLPTSTHIGAFVEPDLSSPMFNLNQYNRTTKCHQTFMPPLLPTPTTRLLAAKAQMGSGKTFQSVKFFSAILQGKFDDLTTEDIAGLARFLCLEAFLLLPQELQDKHACMQEHVRVLCIGPRITFDRHLARLFGQFGVGFYQSPESLRRNPGFCVYQFESIYKTQGYGKQPFDILFIDESEAVMRQVTSGLNHTKYLMNLNTFADLVKQSRLIIALDAGLTRRTLEVLMAISAEPRPFGHTKDTDQEPITLENVTFLENTYKNMPRTYYYHRSRDSILTKLKTDLAAGNKVCIPVGHKREDGLALMKMITLEFPKLRAIFYSADTKEENHDHFKQDINPIWSQHDVVIFTCSITVGINFSVPDHFQAIYLFVTHTGIPARDYFQMSGRVRHCPNVQLFISHAYKKLPCPVSLESISQSLVEQQTSVINLETLYQTVHVDTKYLFDWNYAPKWCLQLHAFNELERLLSRYNMEEELFTLIHDQGSAIVMVDHASKPLALEPVEQENLFEEHGAAVEALLSNVPREELEQHAFAMWHEHLVQEDHETPEDFTTRKQANDRVRVTAALAGFMLEFPNFPVNCSLVPEFNRSLTKVRAFQYWLETVGKSHWDKQRDWEAIRKQEHSKRRLNSLIEPRGKRFSPFYIVQRLFTHLGIKNLDTSIKASSINVNVVSNFIKNAFVPVLSLTFDARRNLASKMEGDKDLTTDEIIQVASKGLRRVFPLEFRSVQKQVNKVRARFYQLQSLKLRANEQLFDVILLCQKKPCSRKRKRTTRNV